MSLVLLLIMCTDLVHNVYTSEKQVYKGKIQIQNTFLTNYAAPKKKLKYIQLWAMSLYQKVYNSWARSLFNSPSVMTFLCSSESISEDFIPSSGKALLLLQRTMKNPIEVHKIAKILPQNIKTNRQIRGKQKPM